MLIPDSKPLPVCSALPFFLSPELGNEKILAQLSSLLKHLGCVSESSWVTFFFFFFPLFCQNGFLVVKGVVRIL